MGALGTFIKEQFFQTPRWAPQSQTLLTGRTAIVTGANGGIGFEAAIKLAGLQPKLLILAVRSVSKGEAAKAELVNRSGLSADRVEVWELDLSSFASVQAFAARVNKLDRLDVLLENAGVQFGTWKETDDKWEQVLQVNGLSTGLLGSDGHGLTQHIPVPAGKSILEDLNDPKGKNAGSRYEYSKLVSVFLARKIATLPAAKGVVVNVVNPGLCASNLAEVMNLPALALTIIGWVARTTEVGARNLAWALENDTPPGAYISVTSVRPSSAYSRSAEGIKVENELWAELVELWVQLDASVRQVVA